MFVVGENSNNGKGPSGDGWLFFFGVVVSGEGTSHGGEEETFGT